MTLTVFRGPDAWYVRYGDPSISTLFGTDTLPTAFTPEAPLDDVLRALAERHPHHRVTIAHDHVTLHAPRTTTPD